MMSTAWYGAIADDGKTEDKITIFTMSAYPHDGDAYRQLETRFQRRQATRPDVAPQKGVQSAK